MRADCIEEVTVVTDHQHRMFKVRQEVFQPLHSVEVEVVGRLVEQEVVRIAIKRLCQHDAHLLLTRQFRHHLVVQIFLDAQTRKKLSGIALGIPAIELCKLLLQLSSTNAVFVREIRLGIEGILLLHDVPEHRVSHHHRVDDGAIIKFEVVLREHREAFAWTKSNCTFRGFKFTADGFEQRRFTGTICTNHTIDITIGELHVHILVENTLAKLDGKVRNCYHLLLPLDFGCKGTNFKWKVKSEK